MSHSTGNLWKPVTFVLELSEINSEGFVEFYSSSHFDGTQGFDVWRGANLHLVDLNFQIKDNVKHKVGLPLDKYVPMSSKKIHTMIEQHYS